MENAWSDTSNYAIDGVSLHWFPKDLNLRKILTSKVKIKRGNWTGSSDSSGTLLLKDLFNANACWLVLIYDTLIITYVAKRISKYVSYNL